MPKRRRAGARDFESRTTVWIRAGNFCVSRHPVMIVRLSLFCRQQWQNSCERVHREGLAVGKGQVFAADIEIITNAVAADHRVGIANDLNPQVPEFEFVIILVHVPTPDSESSITVPHSRETANAITDNSTVQVNVGRR